MEDEKNLLKAIKNAGLSHADVLGILKDKGVLGDKLLTVEERLAKEQEKAEREKKEKEKEKEAEPEEEDEEEEEPEEEEEEKPKPTKEDIILKKLNSLGKELKELKTKGIPLKTPSKGKEMKEADLPEGVEATLKRNKFEITI